MKDKKIITFKENYRGETYVAFAEDKTELYVFKKFLNWISWYSHSFSNYFYILNKDNLTQIVNDFETFLSLSDSFKYCEYGSEEELTEDLLSILHVFSERNHELRRCKTEINKELKEINEKKEERD